MLARLVIAAVLALAAVVTARVVERRRRVDAPPRDRWPVPRQLDRADFPRPDAPWLVVLFSASTCESCAAMAEKVSALEGDEVATVEIEHAAATTLHERYGIEGVPVVVIADHEGVVRRAFVGPASAAHLWSAVAECRAPGSTSEPGIGAFE
jgi:hypothetical protein